MRWVELDDAGGGDLDGAGLPSEHVLQKKAAGVSTFTKTRSREASENEREEGRP